jgi:hypothetical protein
MNVADKLWELNRQIKNAIPPQKKLMTLEKYRLIKVAEKEGYVITTESDEMQTIFHLKWRGVEVIHARIPNNILAEIEDNIEKWKLINTDIEGIPTDTDPTSASMDKMWRDLGMTELGMRD